MHQIITKSRLPNHLLSVIFALVYGVSALAADAGNTTVEPGAKVSVLPSWSLPDANGDSVEFRPSENNPYRVVLFWATWCPYCKALMPHLERFRVKHENTAATPRLEFLALNVWEDGEPEVYMTESGYHFRLVPNADQIAKDYGVKGTPGLFLVNANNEVLYQRRSGTSPEQVITDLEFVLANGQAAKN